MPGFLETQSSTNQVEAIYVAYFGRAGDGPGFTYWTNFFGSQVGAGQPTAGTAVAIADSFAVQPEALAKYSLLATPPNLTNPTSPVTIASVQSFINTVYQDLFNHAADATGLAFWQNALLTGKVSIGAAVYTIANGATGNDTTILTNKITAATSFTTDTVSFNTPVNQTLLTAAEQAVAPVGLDPATVTTSQTFSMQFAQNSTQAQLTLTPGVDALVASGPGAIFNAPLVNTPIQIAGASFNIQTLTPNDTLKDSVGDGTLNANFSANNGFGVVPNVTMSGIATANLVNITGPGGLAGFEGNVTGLTTVNDSNSNAGIQLGQLGAGLNTPLKTVSVTGFTGANGSPLFAGIIAAKAGSAANSIAVSLSGTLGGTAPGAADKLTFSTDGPAGTKASPNTSYGTWALTVNSNANLQLQQGGVGSAATLQLLGAGAVALGSDGIGNWQNLKSIDASGSTGNVTITGHAAGQLGNVAGTASNPGGFFGSAFGLLDGNTALTSYKLSGGAAVNVLDVSSLSTPTLLGGLTTTPGTNTAATNEIVVTSLDADTTVTSTFANIQGFQILGVTGAGGDTGTITWSNLPTTFNDIVYFTQAAGALTIKAAPVTLTVDVEDNALGNNLTVNATAASSLTIINGNAATKAFGTVGAVTLTGEEHVTFTAQGPAAGPAGAGDDLFGSVLITPASLSGTVAVTIGGSSSVDFGGGPGVHNGAIVDLSFGVTPIALNTNNLTITDNDTAVTVFHSALAGGPLAAPITGDTSPPPVYSTNALTIDAHASGGLIMQGGDANHSILTNAGDTITGSTTAGNILIGSIGNDVITGTLSTTLADTVDTGGGKDTIALASGHTVGDQVDLYGGSTLALVGGTATNGSAGTVVDATDHAQLGWWGLATNGTATVPVGAAAPPALFATGGGTSADMSTVSGFAPGGTTGQNDSVNLSITSFSGLLHDAGLGGAIAAPAAAAFTAALAPGATVGAASATVLLLGTAFANATALATSLSQLGTTIHLTTATTAPIEHFIAAYQDLSGSVRIADIDLHSVPPVKSFAAGQVAVSDMVQLTGVSLAQLQTSALHDNVHFVA